MLDRLRRMNNQRGFTLIEIILVLSLSVLVIGLVLQGTSSTYKMYDKTSSKIDAQSQFRLMMDFLREEVGNSEYVELADAPPTGVFDPPSDPKYAGKNFYCIYIEKDADDKGRIVRRTGTGLPEPIGNTPYPLKNLAMEFSIEHEKNGDPFPGVFRVTLKANENSTGGYADIYEGTVSITNSKSWTIDKYDAELGNVAIYYIEPESYEDLL